MLAFQSNSLTWSATASSAMRTWSECWWLGWFFHFSLICTTEASKFIEYRRPSRWWMWWHWHRLATFILGILIRSRRMWWWWRTIWSLLWNIHWIVLFVVFIRKSIFGHWRLFFATFLKFMQYFFLLIFCSSWEFFESNLSFGNIIFHLLSGSTGFFSTLDRFFSLKQQKQNVLLVLIYFPTEFSWHSLFFQLIQTFLNHFDVAQFLCIQIEYRQFGDEPEM